MTDLPVVHETRLEPLPFHAEIRDYLKAQDAAVWNWFAAHQSRRDQGDAVRFDLLKTTYRLDRASQPALYEAAELAAAGLDLDVPLTIYQAQQSQGLNASIAALADEAHIVLDGPVAERLTELELTALMAHELGHLLLWRILDGELLIADQVLAALTNDRQAAPPHFHSARLFGLYNEIFGDRAALAVVEDPRAVVGTLVKMETGLKQVSAESYMKQAEEIFSRENARTEGLTHPEAFIRARAIQLWSEQAPDVNGSVRRMIEGPLALDELDLLGQQRVAGLTRRLIDALIRPAWMRSDLVLGHARLFFDDYQPPPTDGIDRALADDLGAGDDAMRDYFCYVMLDFVTADRDMDETSLAAALDLAERLGWKPRFVELAQKELRLRKKQLQQIDEQREKILRQANKEAKRS